MKLKVVSIVGKPNTGKSSLFNALVGRGKAIVFDRAGTTIDVNKEIVDIDGVKFILQDTGGYMLDNEDDTDVPPRLTGRVRGLLEEAIDESDLILFTVVYNNVSFLDYELADMLRKYMGRVKVVVTKVDTIHQRIQVVDDVYRLGFGDVMFVSSKTKYGFDELVDFIKMFILENSEEQVQESEQVEVRVAIVGRVNVGKSTLMNALLGRDRVMVDDEPGTTRDSVDDFLNMGSVVLRVTDTAGFRRSIFRSGLIERFGVERTESAINGSDVVIVVIDGKEGITRQDRKVLKVVIDRYKPFVIAVNKWDLVVGVEKLKDQKEMERYTLAFADFFSRTFEGVGKAPVVLISARENYNIDKLLEEVFKVMEKRMKRISTGLLNRKLRALVPQYFGGEVVTKLKIYYITQTEVNPPTFVVFVNKLKHFRKNVENFIIRKISEIFDFCGVPIKVVARERAKKDGWRGR